MQTAQTASDSTHSRLASPGFTVGSAGGFLPAETRDSDIFGLWAEITYGDPMPVSTPVAKRIQEKWRAMEGSDYCERMKFIIAATEAECPGLWSDIAYAGVNQMALQDKQMMETTHAELEAAGAMASETMAKARRRVALDRYHAFQRGKTHSTPSA